MDVGVPVYLPKNQAFCLKFNDLFKISPFREAVTPGHGSPHFWLPASPLPGKSSGFPLYLGVMIYRIKIAVLAIIAVAAGMQGLIAQENSDCNCCSEAYHQFDFWLGKWEVKLADGSVAGENRIEITQGGCALRESWTSAREGFTGTSLNFYNPATGLWEQVWVDNSGTVLKLKGGRKGNQMILSSEALPGPDGREGVNRITWTLLEDGRVRQLWELIQGGNQPRVIFDGYYRKIPD